MNDPRQARDLDGLRQRLEALCRAIAPRDLGDVPVYVAFASELPAEFHCTAKTGFHLGCLDLLLRPFIDWHGRGPAWVLDDITSRQSILETCPWVTPEKLQRFLIDSLAVTGVHEVCHVLADGVLFSDPPGFATHPRLAVSAMREAIGEVNARETAAWDSGTVEVDLASHDWRFIRTALHVAQRCQRLGVDVHACRLCAGALYGLSDAGVYQLNLEPELRSMADASFAEIRATPIPDMVTALYRRDVRQREERKQQARGNVARAVLPVLREDTRMSVVKELVGKIARRLDAAKQKRESDYDALVRKIADGKEPPLETVEATLQGAGKTAADLEAAVELLVERRRLRAIADKLPALESEAAALQVKAGKANAILEAAEQEHARAIHPIQCRLEEIAQARYAAQSAVTELRRIYRGPEVTERSAAINARLNDLRNRRVRLDVDRSRLQAELDRLNARIRLGGDAQFIASCRHDAAELEKGIARFSQELADNEAESARLVSEQDGLVKQMIEV